MIGALRRGAGIACIRLAFIPIRKKKLDENQLENPLTRDPDSGIDRVLKIFDRDEFGTISPEASFVNTFTFAGTLTGAVYGGLLRSRMENFNFRENNEATLYYSQKAAQRELLDRTALGFGKGALRFGVRYAIFCFSFAGLSTFISRFRGESGVLEYSLGGLVTGAIYKFGLGPKGMLSGGFFGLVIGTIGGLSIYALTKISGVTMEDVYGAAHAYFRFKDSNFHQAFRTQLENPDLLLDIFYPDGTGSMEHTLDELKDIKSTSELKFNKNVVPNILKNTDTKK